MRIAHIVVTDNFAGTERYVLDLGCAQAAVGHDVTVLGGDGERMRAGLAPAGVRWSPAGDLPTAANSLRRLGRLDVLHSHLTTADLLAGLWPRTLARRRVSTRHIATVRGSAGPVRAVASVLSRRIDVELAISKTVADAMERPPDAIVLNGVHPQPLVDTTRSRTVLVAQRLQPEKCTPLAVHGFARSGLAAAGWRLLIAGDGPDRAGVAAAVASEGLGEAVDLLGWRPDVGDLMASAGLFVATARREPLGLSVLEAMARGLPVLATAAGGHLETAGRAGSEGLVPPDDPEALGRAMRRFGADAALRAEWGAALRAAQQEHFSHAQHAASVLEHYQEATCA